MDIRLFEWLNGLAGWGHWLDYVAWFFAVFGLGLQLLFVVLRWCFPSDRPRRSDRYVVLLAVIGAVLALGLAQVPQAVWYRPRPRLRWPRC